MESYKDATKWIEDEIDRKVSQDVFPMNERRELAGMVRAWAFIFFDERFNEGKEQGTLNYLLDRIWKENRNY